ncbi:hypothetical protein B7463_g3222, partial [Scytalidium lignicola]
MASAYLANQAQTLESTASVDPSQAQVAQIPLQTFSLPTFPEEAFKSGLESLILTSDIKLDEYTDILTQPFSVSNLPASIKSLTLELFSLGYPPGFLNELGKKFSGLKAITVYSQLIGGTTKESREDAIAFVKSQTELQEAHLLDVFGSPGFFAELGESLSPNLKLLEINYTYRHSDPKFLETIPSKEMAAFIGKGKQLVGLTLSISPPDITDDDEDLEGTEVGVRPVSGKHSESLVEALVENGKDIIVLDLTMFELSLEDLEKVLDSCHNLKGIHITVSLEKGWKEVFDVLGKKERGIEFAEFVGAPGESILEELKNNKGEINLDEESLNKLSNTCKDLKALSLSILKVKVTNWTKDGDKWQKQ